MLRARSRVRARLLFVLLDAISVSAGYGLAEVIYFRHKPPADYWQHFALFLAAAVIVALTANHLFGLYERMWRHAGAQEASQLCLAALATMAILLAFDLIWRMYSPELVPVSVVVVGCLFSTIGMGIIRFPLAIVCVATGIPADGSEGRNRGQLRYGRCRHSRDAELPERWAHPGSGIRR